MSDDRAPVTAPLIAARGLTKRFGKFTAVDAIDFEVAQGESFGFLGPNGAGKTSTMRMIGCVSPISAGELRILGLDPVRDGPAIRGRLGVVPQQDTLDTDLSVIDNLVIYGRYFGLPRAESARRARELLEFAQLSERAQDKVEPLSGGMKRRLTIARALINEPSVLLLDEPTTGLDPQARHLLWERLYRLKQRGVTLVLTTHYMDEAEQLHDRHARLLYALGVGCGRHVALYDADPVFLAKGCQRLLQQRRLARAGRGHQVYDEDAVLPEQPPVFFRDTLVRAQYVRYDFNLHHASRSMSSICISRPDTTCISGLSQCLHEKAYPTTWNSIPQALHLAVRGTSSMTRLAPSAMEPFVTTSKANLSASSTTPESSPILRRTAVTFDAPFFFASSFRISRMLSQMETSCIFNLLNISSGLYKSSHGYQWNKG